MPEEVLNVVRDVLARVRDPQGSMHSQALCLDLLTRLQTLYNNIQQLVYQTTTITTSPKLQVYPFLQYFLDASGTISSILVTNVTQNERPLERFTLSQLRALNPYWPREVGGRLEGYCQLGFSHLILYPALEESTSVVVTATKVTANVRNASEATQLDVPTESTPMLLALLEMILLLRQRNIEEFDAHATAYLER